MANINTFLTTESLNNTNLTGTPTAPTAAVGTSTTQIATTEFVQNSLPTAASLGLESAMHFKGAVASLPTDNTNYSAGDVIIITSTNKEYVLNGDKTSWIELGDESSYVLKEDGKSLISNSDITKLANIEYGATKVNATIVSNWGFQTQNTTLSGIANCNTDATAATKTAILPNFALADEGQTILLYVKNTNTATDALTLNVNSTSTLPIYLNDEITSSTNCTLLSGYYRAVLGVAYTQAGGGGTLSFKPNYYWLLYPFTDYLNTLLNSADTIQY